jgi:hypothetical protein
VDNIKIDLREREWSGMDWQGQLLNPATLEKFRDSILK